MGQDGTGWHRKLVAIVGNGPFVDCRTAGDSHADPCSAPLASQFFRVLQSTRYRGTASVFIDGYDTRAYKKVLLDPCHL